MGEAPLVVASNRGPRSFSLDDHGSPVRTGSAGGLAGALARLVARTGATWVACAMSEGDRQAVAEGLMDGGYDDDGIELVMIAPDPASYRMAYDVVANSTLWNCHHHLFDLARRPLLDERFGEAFDAFRDLNAHFAEALSEVAGPEATVLVQDYHLCLVPGMLRDRRPDLHVVHFTHTPFAAPSMWRVLPDRIGDEILESMSRADSCGFHASRWERDFLECCAEAKLAPPRTVVSPLGADPHDLARRARSEECIAAGTRLDDVLDGRRAIVRTDRIEPSKNLLRGFWAFDEMLRHRPDLRGSVVMVAHAYPSRQSLPEYLAYASEVEHTAARVNETWGNAQWTPVLLEVADDPDRALAALTRYDVLLVNPVRDGLNLVAKEGPLVNTVDGVLVLSREAGAFEELGAGAIGINPFDASETARAMADALDMSPAERNRRAETLRLLTEARPAGAWFDDQLAAGR
jgi:trehalose 6-phosphate synthase